MLGDGLRFPGNTVRHRSQDVKLGQWSRPCVTLFEQDPLFGSIPRPRDANQFPPACELTTLQVEEDLPAGQAFTGVAYRRPSASVPDDHGASSVIAFWYFALETGVVQRVVLDMDRYPFLGWVKAWSFGDGPADKDAVEFEPKIIMKPAGPVLLNHEGQRLRASARTFGTAGWLGRRREIALRIVALEGSRARCHVVVSW
ncbi:hypothetical protein DFLDMN_004795 [Cupriavidus sp. H19C3]